MAIELVIFIDIELGRILDAAALTVVIAVFSVDSRIDLGKEGSFRRFGKATVQARYSCRGVCRCQEGSATLEGGAEGGGHCAAVGGEGSHRGRENRTKVEGPGVG